MLTPNGGRHYEFRHRGRALKSGAGLLGAGLDTRGEGGYRILPPSVGANGRSYKYMRPGKVELADPPEWLFEVLEEQLRLTVAAEVEEIIPEGKRRQAMLSVAGSMRRRGLTGAEILPALLKLNERCRPPLGRREIEELAADVGKRYQPNEKVAVTAPEEPNNSFPPPIDKERGGNETGPGASCRSRRSPPCSRRHPRSRPGC